jgi:hypothetical protein
MDELVSFVGRYMVVTAPYVCMVEGTSHLGWWKYGPITKG